MIRNKASNKFRTFFTCLFISLFVVGFISIPLQADDYTTKGFEITVFNPKNGKSFTENLKFILHNGNYYTTNGNIASCGMFDLASPEDNCKSYKRDVFSLYDNKKLKDVTYSFNNDDYFEYDGNYWFNFNKSMELLKTKVLFDGERIMVFPLKYTPEEIRIMLIDIFDRSEFKIEENSIDSAFADTWKLMKSGNYSGLLSGSEMVDEYTSLLVEIGQPNNKELEISNNLSKYYSASGTVGAVEKVLNGWTALDNLYVVKWTTEESETGPNGETVTKKKNHVTTRLYTPGYDINSLALSPKQAAISILNANEKEWGTWFDNLIDKEKDIVSIYKSYNSLKEIKNENPSYVKAMRYGIMVNPGTGDLLHGKAYTKDNRYMYDAANTLQTKMSDVYNFVGYSIADEFLKYGTSTINKQITEQLFSGYRKILVDAFFAAADQYGISEHMDKVQYAAMCRYIMEKCADNFNKAPGDLESMKYCTLMYLKTFLIYNKKYAKYTNYIANEEQILSAIMEISSLNDDDLYGFSIEHVFDANCNYIALQGYNSKNSLKPVTYGYNIVIKGSSVGNLIIPNEYNGLPVLEVNVSGGSENIRKIVVPSTVHYVDVRNLPNLEELILPDNVNSVSLDDYIIIRNFNTLSLDISSLPSLKRIKLNDSVTNLSVYNVGIEEICIPKSVEHYGVWQCKDLKKVSFSEGIETTKGVVSECDSLIDIQFPQSLKTICKEAFKQNKGALNVVIPEGVTSIGENAFEYCIGLMSVKIPDSMTTIGQFAFYDCESLEEVTVPGNVSVIEKCTFDRCYSLKRATICDGVRIIGRCAFETCESLTSVLIPDSVTDIGECAFQYCSSLNDFSLPKSLETMGDKAFCECVGPENITIPGSLTAIPQKAFYKCNGIKNVQFSDGLVIIDKDAFRECEKIESIDLPNSLTTINFGAFYDCKGLISAKIPDSVVSIEHSIFEGCNNLITVVMSNNITVITSSLFHGCSKLTNFNMPDNVTSIEPYAFYGCESLKSIRIPDSVSKIYSAAFANCKSITEIVIPEGITSLPDQLFEGCISLSNVSIPDSVTSYGSASFSGCRSLKTIRIPDKITVINDKLFNGCENLEDITLPDCVTTIGERAFANCKKFTKFTIPDGITEINELLFYGCENMESITIPNSVTSIGKSAFGNCKKLTGIAIPESITNISDGLFNGCTHLVSFNIPKNVTSIGSAAFSDCTSLTSLQIPNGVTTIGEKAFYNCSNLLEINIPDGITKIEDSVFYKCNRLSDITMPKGVTSIGDYAFSECYCFTNLIIPSSVTRIGRSAFSICNFKKVTLYNSVTKISDFAFSACYELKDVYFYGTESDWKGISIGADNTRLTSANIHYLQNCDHDMTHFDGKDATCSEDGYEEYYECSKCHKKFSDADGTKEISAPIVIKAFGHSWDEGTETKPATCEESGEKTYHCTREGCNETKKETIDALGHKLKEVPEKAPTKTETGNIAHFECEMCHKLFRDADGKEAISVEQTIIPVMTHNLTFVKAKTATCTEAGNKEYYKCDDPDCNCGKLYSDKYGRREIKIENTIIPANGPNLSYQKAPTCTEDGIELYYKCSECGKLFSDREGKHEIEHYKTIPKLGHDFEKVESVKETYHKDGNIEYYLCKRCGKKYADIEGKIELNDAEIIIPKKGAAALGETAQAGDLQYKITNPSTDGSGTVTLIGVENGSSTVVIPASVEIKECNYKVTVIGANAFNGNETIKTLFIGVNLVAIDTKAFYGCTNLTKVSGGAGLKSIGSYAFAKCPKLSYFKLTSKVLTKIGAYDFSGDKKLKTLYIKYTTKLTKSGVKKSLKGSKIKTVKVKKSKMKKYKKYFTKKNCGRKVKVKK